MGFLRSFGDKNAGRGDIGVKGDGKGEVGTEEPFEMDFEDEERERGLNLKRLEMLERLELCKEWVSDGDRNAISERRVVREHRWVGGWRHERTHDLSATELLTGGDWLLVTPRTNASRLNRAVMGVAGLERDFE